MAQHHRNFAYSTVVIAPSPATTGTSLTVQPGDGNKFPECPFQATVWPAGAQPLSTTAEIVTVIANSDDTFTLSSAPSRNQEGSFNRTIIVGDQIAATITAKTLTDAEDPVTSWSPMILANGATALQTLASATGQSSSASLLVFPVTVPINIEFNQIIVPASYSIVTSVNQNTCSFTYYSKYGLYSMNANTLSLISSSFFSINESLANQSVSWNYPTSTATSGWGYGGFPAGSLTGSNQWMSMVGSLRTVGLHFGGDMTLTGGVYWMGLLSYKDTASQSGIGLSMAGIIGQPINAINQPGTVSGLNPLGLAASQWSNQTSHMSAWYGRHLAGFITATSLTEFGGTKIPSAISLNYLGAIAAASTVTVLPAITFVST